jgi:tetratricopeptide (TPR) repeat protein
MALSEYTESMQQLERRLVRILVDQIERTVSDRPQQALELCEQLFRFASEAENELLIGDATYFRGKAYAVLRKHDLALSNFEQALLVFREQKAHERRSEVLNSIGAIHQMRKQRITAIRYYHSALQAAREAGVNEKQYKPLVNLAQIFQAEHNYEQALVFTRKALKLAEATGIEVQLAKVYLMAAKLSQIQGDVDQAYLSALSALERAEQEGSVTIYSSASYTLAITQIKRGNTREAERILTALISYQRKHDLRGSEAVSAIELVKIWFKTKQHRRAFELLIDQITNIRKNPDIYPPESFVIFKLVGDYCRFVQHDMEAANRYYTMYLHMTKGVWKTYLTD